MYDLRPLVGLARGAGWGLVLAAVVSLAGATPTASGAPRPPGVASSVSRAPAAVLPSLRAPEPPADHPTRAAEPHRTSTATPHPTPTTTPAARPSPEPVATPTAAPTPVAPEPPPSPPTPTPLPTDEPEPGYPDTATATAVLEGTNQLRAQNGLPPLAAGDALTAAAQSYAGTMAAYDWFSHKGPDGSTFISRAEVHGYTGWSYLAENLYKGSAGEEPDVIVAGLAASATHRESMLSPEATETGVGCYVRAGLRWCAQELGAR